MRIEGGLWAIPALRSFRASTGGEASVGNPYNAAACRNFLTVYYTAEPVCGVQLEPFLTALQSVQSICSLLLRGLDREVSLKPLSPYPYTYNI